MAWEDELFALFDDLEGQAEALYAVEREAEVVDRSRTEYRQVSLISRLMASVDQQLEIEVSGVGRLAGLLRRVGPGWCLLEAVGVDWMIRLPGISVVHGPSPRSVPEIAWSPVQQLGFASACRRLADRRTECLIHLIDGTRHEAVVSRVGQDFLEVYGPAGPLALVAEEKISAISSPPPE